MYSGMEQKAYPPPPYGYPPPSQQQMMDGSFAPAPMQMPRYAMTPATGGAGSDGSQVPALVTSRINGPDCCERCSPNCNNRNPTIHSAVRILGLIAVAFLCLGAMFDIFWFIEQISPGYATWTRHGEDTSPPFVYIFLISMVGWILMIIASIITASALDKVSGSISSVLSGIGFIAIGFMAFWPNNNSVVHIAYTTHVILVLLMLATKIYTTEFKSNSPFKSSEQRQLLSSGGR